MEVAATVSRMPYVLPFQGTEPRFAADPLLGGRGASVLGRVQIGARARLGAFSVIRADGHYVQIGNDFSLGRNATVHIAHEVYPAIIGDRVAVGRNAVVHACTVGDDCTIENNVVVLDGSVVENRVVIERNSVIFPRSMLKSGYVYAGSPAKPVRELTDDDYNKRNAEIRQEQDLSPGLSDGELRALDSRDSQNFVARTAALSGDVVLSAQASVFFSCVLDAGESTISVGDNSNIQDNTWIRCDSDRVAIGRDTTLGHNVDVRDCTIGNRCLIGIGSVLTAGTIVEDDVLLAAGSTTVPSQRLSSGFLWAGRPARSLSKLDDSKREMMRLIVEQYCGYANAFREVQQQSR